MSGSKISDGAWLATVDTSSTAEYDIINFKKTDFQQVVYKEDLYVSCGGSHTQHTELEKHQCRLQLPYRSSRSVNTLHGSTEGIKKKRKKHTDDGKFCT